MTMPATVPMTLDEIKAELGGNANRGGASDDAAWERLAAAATAAIEGRLGYRIVSATYEETLDGPGHEILLLGNPPCDLQHVYEDTARVFASDSELALGTDFVAPYWREGKGAGTGCRHLVRLDGSWTSERQAIRVVYIGGWTWNPATPTNLVPEDIRRAIFLTAARMRDMRSGLLGKASVSLPGGGGVQPVSTIELTAAVPKEARELIEPYIWDTDAVW